jgi:hypothetical protein
VAEEQTAHPHVHPQRQGEDDANAEDRQRNGSHACEGGTTHEQRSEDREVHRHGEVLHHQD